MTEKIHPSARAMSWWRELRNASDLGVISRIRHGDIDDVKVEPRVIELAQELGLIKPWQLERVAVLAIALSYVKRHDPRPLGRAIGRVSFNKEHSAKVRLPRFQALMNADDPERLLQAIRSVVQIMEGEVNVFDLASLTLFPKSENIRERIALDYFAVRESNISEGA